MSCPGAIWWDGRYWHTGQRVHVPPNPDRWSGGWSGILLELEPQPPGRWGPFALITWLDDASEVRIFSDVLAGELQPE